MTQFFISNDKLIQNEPNNIFYEFCECNVYLSKSRIIS